MLLHGHGCDHGFWAPPAAALGAAGFPVEAPDFPFHGGPTAGYAPTLASLADFCAALLAPGPPAVLAGHSLGGMVATAVAQQSARACARI